MSRTSFYSLGALGFLAVATCPAGATFHLMQIEQVIGGVNGDTTAQAIQLRMRTFKECFVSQGKLIAYDAAGRNPMLLIDLNVDLPGCAPGDRVLITSPSFADHIQPPLAGDFTLTNLIPASYLAAGSITFEDDAGAFVFWRLSWGGGGYTGDTTGAIFNDPDSDFGPPWPGPLPSNGEQALLFQGLAGDLSSTNANDYALTKGAATFTNNAGQSATISCPPGCPWDFDGCGVVGTLDLLILLQSWGTDPGGPPDFDGDGNVGILDLLALLTHWGPCP